MQMELVILQRAILYSPVLNRALGRDDRGGGARAKQSWRLPVDRYEEIGRDGGIGWVRQHLGKVQRARVGHFGVGESVEGWRGWLSGYFGDRRQRVGIASVGDFASSTLGRNGPNGRERAG